MYPRRLSSCLLAMLPLAAIALEVVGNAPYLDHPYRADWRSAPLVTVLKELEKQAAPIVPSAGLFALRDTRLITLVDTAKVPLRRMLAVLERTQDLHITAEPLRLSIETWTEHRDRKRHLVNLALRDYGLFVAPRDLYAPALGFGVLEVNGGGGGFHLSKADDGHHSAGRAPDPEAVVGLLKDIAADTTAELRSRGNLHLMVTDEEEAAIRTALTQVQARMVQRTAWRVSFGTLPAGQPLPTGITTAQVANELLPRLAARRSLDLSALNSQVVHAVDGHQQSLLDDVDAYAAQLDPTMKTILTGVAAQIQPTIGMDFIHLSYHLSWVDPAPPATSELINPGRVRAGSATTTTTITSDPPVKNDTGELVPPKEKTATTTTAHDPGAANGGTSLTITRPVLWTWMPRGELMLPRNHALILGTTHAAGTAVMVLESLP